MWLPVILVRITGRKTAAIAVDRPAARAARRRKPVRKRARSQHVSLRFRHDTLPTVSRTAIRCNSEADANLIRNLAE